MNQRVFACAECRAQGFLGPAGDGRGFFIFQPLLPGGAPVMKDRGHVGIFLADMAFDFCKGLVAGGASLALQAVFPSVLRAVKRLRARWLARKAAAQEKRSATRRRIERRLWSWRRLGR